MKTLNELSQDAISSIQSGYYELPDRSTAERLHEGRRSLVQAIRARSGSSSRAIICEIKFASPSAGIIKSREHADVCEIAREMEAGGATALSVLTDPRNFNGSLANLVEARKSTSLPVVMKDIVVSRDQIDAAGKLGADCILLIEEIFSRGFTKNGLSLSEAVEFAKEKRLEVIVESHTKEGFFRASSEAHCEIFGINNRDLDTFETNMNTTVGLLESHSTNKGVHPRIILSESGFEKPPDISDLVNALKVRNLQVPDAFLIGTSIMRSSDIEGKVRQFVAGRE